jgi:hypothetical protein
VAKRAVSARLDTCSEVLQGKVSDMPADIGIDEKIAGAHWFAFLLGDCTGLQ